MKIKAVLFDLDDTLYGEFPECDRLGYLAAGAYAEEHFGIPQLAFGQAMRDARDSLRDELPDLPESHDRTLSAQRALERLDINPIAHAHAIHDAYWNAVLDAMQRREGVRELLVRLQEAGVPVGVCTNMTAEIQMEKLRRLGIDDVCGLLISSAEAGKDKPHAPIFRLALRKLGTPAEQTLMVGDSFQHDIRGALGVGMPALWLNLKREPCPVPGAPIYEAFNFPAAAAQIARLCGLRA